ncbi:hypothetical protein ACFZA1_41935 [Streptomyces filipinensis]|uniref:hypothetical protein n=1 Tax=Streptomyces filipinensis TaxID=66887 RepID=UPI0036EAD75B
MHLTSMNTRSRLIPGAASAFLAGFVLTACGNAAGSASPHTSPSSTVQPITREVTLEANGRTMTTVIPVGGCQKGQLSGSEGDSAVTLELSLTTHQTPNQACAANIKLDHVSYTLRTALGDRKVIDKATGKPIKIVKR